MFINILKILILLLFVNIKPVYSKITKNTDFKTKNLSNYFSALVSFENQQNKDSLKFFNSSKSLIHFHEPYLRNYINSLVHEGKIKKAAHELKFASNENNLNYIDTQISVEMDKAIEFAIQSPINDEVELYTDIFEGEESKPEKVQDKINKILSI